MSTTTTVAVRPQRIRLRQALAAGPVDLEPAIEVFHRCLQRGWLEGALLDVADYRHVPDGPGVLVVGHDVDYGLTRDALTVTRKRAHDDDAATQVRDLLRMAAVAELALAYDGTLDVRLRRDDVVEVSLLDRRLAAELGGEDGPGDVLAAAVAPAFAAAWGDGGVAVRAHRHRDPRRPLRVLADPGPVATGARDLVDRLGGSRAPMQSPFDVPVEELAARLGDPAVTVLDVREESEYSTANLGGRLIPLAQLPDRLDELDREATVLVHCRAGRRGGLAVRVLREAGFDDAWNVNGALVAWADRVDPTFPRY